MKQTNIGIVNVRLVRNNFYFNIWIDILDIVLTMCGMCGVCTGNVSKLAIPSLRFSISWLWTHITLCKYLITCHTMPCDAIDPVHYACALVLAMRLQMCAGMSACVRRGYFSCANTIVIASRFIVDGKKCREAQSGYKQSKYRIAHTQTRTRTHTHSRNQHMLRTDLSILIIFVENKYYVYFVHTKNLLWTENWKKCTTAVCGMPSVVSDRRLCVDRHFHCNHLIFLTFERQSHHMVVVTIFIYAFAHRTQLVHGSHTEWEKC